MSEMYPTDIYEGDILTRMDADDFDRIPSFSGVSEVVKQNTDGSWPIRPDVVGIVQWVERA